MFQNSSLQKATEFFGVAGEFCCLSLHCSQTLGRNPHSVFLLDVGVLALFAGCEGPQSPPSRRPMESLPMTYRASGPSAPLNAIESLFRRNLTSALACEIFALEVMIPFNSARADDYSSAVYEVEFAVLFVGIFKVDGPIPLLGTPGSPSHL